MTANPNIAVFSFNMDAPCPAKDRSLGRDVLVRSPAAADQPLRCSGIETAGDGILRHRITRDERAELEVNLRWPRLGSDDSDFQPAQRRKVRLHSPYLFRRSEQHTDPFRAVNQPRGVDQLGFSQAKRCSNPAPDGSVNGTETGQRGRSESEPPVVALDADQACTALLDHKTGRHGDSAALKPGVGRA